jgi:hypothetical protein
MTMTLIETKTLGSNQATIEFTSIPQDGTDLLILAAVRTTRSDAGNDNIDLTMNGGGTITAIRLAGTGSSVFTDSTSTVRAYVTSALNTANTFGNASFYIPNYTASQNKSVSVDSVTENNATAAIPAIHASLIANTAAITSLTFDAIGDLVTGSTISLYKITKGSDGIVTTS